MEDKRTCTSGDCKHIQGINCDVSNCYYNEKGCYCTAKQIAVGPSYATSSTDTVCATFKKKD
ncbi:MAG: DUF1540 domain-containing protein [Ruminococcaceae bacterium]|nr:DUF1540 domain-containing protein [Oscillospiraceae bacterium]